MFFSAGGAMIQSKWPFSHRDLDSGILIHHSNWIPFSGCSNSSLTPSRLRNCTKTFAHKFKFPLNWFLFFLILCHFFGDWFFFFFFLNLSVELRHIRSSVSFSKALPVCKHAFHYMVFIRLHRHGEQREQRGLDVQGTRPRSWRLPDSGTMTKIQKPDLFACSASKRSCSSSLRSRDLD